MSSESDKDELEGVDCPNCGHPQTEPINDIWKDPNVRLALKDGRSAEDICVLRCPKCDRYGYYNQGKFFSCRFCKREWLCCNEDENPPPNTPYLIWLDGFTSLADTVTFTTDGYDNETQA